MEKTQIKAKDEIIDLKEDVSSSPLYSIDLAPVSSTERRWNKWHIAAIWIGMAVCIPTYMLGSGLIQEGMNWWQALITVSLGNVIVMIPMLLNSHIGTKYGIPLPVVLRLSFGTRGAVVAALFRGVVACGWFGIQTWIGGAAIYQLLLVFFPGLATSASLGGFIGLNMAQAVSFLIFLAMNMWIVHKGIHALKFFETWSAPFLLVIGLVLIIWAWNRVGSFSHILHASYLLSSHKGSVDFWKIFFPGLTGMVGFWATLSLNIPDFTRYVRTQKDQRQGQMIGLVPTMMFYAFVGIFVTSATIIIFGKAIWNPVTLLGMFKSPVVVIIAMIGLVIATLTTNLAANVVAPANDFANIMPRKITFKMGGYLTGIIGILMFPWKLMSDPHGYIFLWLVAYSALLGAVAGVMIADYYVIRKTKFNLAEAYKENGIFKGWSKPGWIAFVLSLLPVIPGFLVAVKIFKASAFPSVLVSLYSYAWFITFGLSFLIYWILMRWMQKRKMSIYKF